MEIVIQEGVAWDVTIYVICDKTGIVQTFSVRGMAQPKKIPQALIDEALIANPFMDSPRLMTHDEIRGYLENTDE